MRLGADGAGEERICRYNSIGRAGSFKPWDAGSNPAGGTKEGKGVARRGADGKGKGKEYEEVSIC